MFTYMLERYLKVLTDRHKIATEYAQLLGPSPEKADFEGQASVLEDIIAEVNDLVKSSGEKSLRVDSLLSSAVTSIEDGSAHHARDVIIEAMSILDGYTD